MRACTEARIDERKKLVLFDLDLTLIDEAYQFCDHGFAQAASLAIAAGWSLGISSDTPGAGSRYWHERLSFNGPIVIEKGAAVLHDDEILTAVPHAEQFGDLRYTTQAALARVADKVWYGDAPGAIRDGLVVGERGEEIVMVNSLREFSFSAYGGIVSDSGQFVRDERVLKRAVEATRRSYGRLLVDEDVNPGYGIFIAHDARTSKRVGTQALMRRLGIGTLSMVGNSMTDYVGNDIARHYAVANASDEYQACADYISTRPLSAGCAEILVSLVNREN